MCKIGGIFSFDELTDKNMILQLSTKMLHEMISGGAHATGVSIINTKTGFIKVVKAGEDSHKFTERQEFKNVIMNYRYNLVLLHTRYATHGSPQDNKNNHPFLKGCKVLIHNGVLTNYQKILAENDLKLNSECDSETILQLYDKINDIEGTIKEMNGNNAIALYDDKVKKLFVYGSGNRVELAYNRTKNLFVFNTAAQTLTNIFANKKTYFGFFNNETIEDKVFLMGREDEELVTINFKSHQFNKDYVEQKHERYSYETEDDEEDDSQSKLFESDGKGGDSTEEEEDSKYGETDFFKEDKDDD